MTISGKSTPDDAFKPVRDMLLEDKLWGNIRRKARTDPGLQDLLDQCIMYYELSKENKPK